MEIEIQEAVKNFDKEIVPNIPPSELPLLKEFKKVYKTKDFF